MESKNAIEIKNLSKMYRLYNKPSDRLKDSLGFGKKKRYREHYALRDVSFDVREGECVGIIGTNGSGKSTLLKIITGVLNATGGSVEIDGKISALLELGAGFNMEYTGIENIYLNGTMMGFTDEEISKRVNAITEFAEIGEFVNQPVKTYSSGMFARLAFAVAINVDPDILIVDEALSVGDIFFQAKCYRKFTEFKEAGKTIIFVSHDMGSVIKYCDRALLLNKGKPVFTGKCSEAVDIYKKILAKQYHEEDAADDTASDEQVSAQPQTASNWRDQLTANSNLVDYGEKEAEIVDFALMDNKGMVTSTLEKGKSFKLMMKIHFHKDIRNPIFAFTIKDRKGTEITGTNTVLEGHNLEEGKKDQEIVVCFEQVMNLQSGQYLLSLGCTGYELEELVIYHRIYDACFMEVLSNKDTVGFYDMNSKVTYPEL